MLRWAETSFVADATDVAGSLRLQRRFPHPSLARLIEGYFVVDWQPSAGNAARALLIPSATAKCFFFPGSTPRLLISGPRVEPATHRFGGAGRMVGVSFTPAGFHRLSLVPARELVGQLVADAPRVLEAASSLRDRMAAAPDEAAMLSALDDHFRAQVRDTERSASERHVDACLCAFESALPPRRVRDLSEALGVGERQLERAFLEVLGVGPAFALRIARLHRTIRGFGRGDESLARTAAHNGYFDQSHLTNDLRALTGLTPRALAKAIRGVGSFQDRAQPGS